MSLFPVTGTPPAMVLTREGNGLFSLLFGPLSLNLAPLVRGYFFGDSLRFCPRFLIRSYLRSSPDFAAWSPPSSLDLSRPSNPLGRRSTGKEDGALEAQGTRIEGQRGVRDGETETTTHFAGSGSNDGIGINDRLRR